MRNCQNSLFIRCCNLISNKKYVKYSSLVSLYKDFNELVKGFKEWLWTVSTQYRVGQREVYSCSVQNNTIIKKQQYKNKPCVSCTRNCKPPFAPPCVIYRWSIIALYTWNLYNFSNQYYSNNIIVFYYLYNFKIYN